MTITTKTSAKGRTSYYVDGEKVRKTDIDGIINARRNEIIEVDFYVGQEFKMLTRTYGELKVVVTLGDKLLMTATAANALGYKIIREFTTSVCYTGSFYLVEKINEIDAEEYAINEEALQVAIDAEIANAATQKAIDEHNTGLKEENTMTNIFETSKVYVMHTCDLARAPKDVRYQVKSRGKIYLTVNILYANGNIGENERVRILNSSDGEYVNLYDCESGLIVSLYAKDLDENDTNKDQAEFYADMDKRGSEPTPPKKQIIIEACLTENGRLICKCNGKRENIGDVVATCQCAINDVVIVNGNGGKIILNNRYYRSAEGILNEIREHAANLTDTNIKDESQMTNIENTIAKFEAGKHYRGTIPTFVVKNGIAQTYDGTITVIKRTPKFITYTLGTSAKFNYKTKIFTDGDTEYTVDSAGGGTFVKATDVSAKQIGKTDKQADFLKRDAQPCDDSDEVWELIPDVSELNDVEDAPTDEALDIEEMKAALADFRAKKKRMDKEINRLKLRIAALPLPANIKGSLKRAMQIALEKHRYYNSLRLQKEANAERECYLICKKALKVVA